MNQETHPIPEWIVVGAAPAEQRHIGRFHPLSALRTRLCVVDPENSAFFRPTPRRRRDVVTGMSSRIEGIGRPRVEPSFLPTWWTTWWWCPMRRRRGGMARQPGVRPAGRAFDRDESLGAFGLLAEMLADSGSGSV